MSRCLPPLKGLVGKYQVYWKICVKHLFGYYRTYCCALTDAEEGGKYALNTPYRTEVCRQDLDLHGSKLRLCLKTGIFVQKQLN